MTKILKICRSSKVITATVEKDNSRQVLCFAPNKSNADIILELTGSRTEETKEPVEAVKNEEKKTVPEPVATPKERVSRSEMIAALERAKITDFDASKFLSLKCRYARYLQEGK